MKIEIYDPPMCCSSGLCGPALDPVLVKVNDALMALKRQGVQIERYNPTQQPREFMSNAKVAELLRKHGKDVLPVTLINGEVFKTGGYPSCEEMCGALGIKPSALNINLRMGS